MTKPTLQQLQGEQVWRSERIPETLVSLRRSLLDFYAWDAGRIGTIGDARHLRGYHRSRGWILASDYCTDRGYSVTESEGNRRGGDPTWIAGMDIVVGESLARTIHTRVRTAKASGRIVTLREVGLESGPWHVHLGFDRARVAYDHTDLFHVITGNASGGTKMVTVNASMPELSEGAEGSHVVTAQSLLNARGIECKVDGEFGPLTVEATRAMQQKYGAESVDGVWGPETWTIGLAGEDLV